MKEFEFIVKLTGFGEDIHKAFQDAIVGVEESYWEEGQQHWEFANEVNSFEKKEE